MNLVGCGRLATRYQYLLYTVRNAAVKRYLRFLSNLLIITTLNVHTNSLDVSLPTDPLCATVKVQAMGSSAGYNHICYGTAVLAGILVLSGYSTVVYPTAYWHLSSRKTRYLASQER